MLKKSSEVLLLITAAVLLMGCATSVPVTMTRPAELDLQGAKSIAVLPFRLSSDTEQTAQNSTVIVIFGSWGSRADPDEVAVSDHLTSQLEEKLFNSSAIELVGSAAVKAAIENGTQIPVDVYLTGKISSVSSSRSTSYRKETIDGVEQNIPEYIREVSVRLTYQVIDAKSNKIIASKQRTLMAKSSPQKVYDSVPKTFTLIRPELDSLVTMIMQELQPYEIVKNIFMKSDKTKDPDMKRADEFVKSRNIAAAKELYLNLYKSRGYPVAGYNAAQLMQALGSLEEARDLLKELVSVSPDKDVMNALSDVEYEIQQANRLKAQSI